VKAGEAVTVAGVGPAGLWRHADIQHADRQTAAKENWTPAEPLGPQAQQKREGQ
jgi:hypothetical protein